MGEEILSSFEIDNIEPTTLLFQTGYVTIKDTVTRRGRIAYVLGFPNYEVKTAFSDYLINAYTDIRTGKMKYQDDVYNCLLGADLPGLQGVITRLFAGIAHRNFNRNDISNFEGYFASVLYAFFASIDCTVIPEDINNQGQADVTVQLGDNIYVMEIKVVDNAASAAPTNPEALPTTPTAPAETATNSALAQIVARDYAAKYRVIPAKQVFELGLVFGKNERNLLQYDWQT